MKLCKNESIVKDSSSSNSGQTFVTRLAIQIKGAAANALPESSAELVSDQEGERCCFKASCRTIS